MIKKTAVTAVASWHMSGKVSYLGRSKQYMVENSENITKLSCVVVRISAEHFRWKTSHVILVVNKLDVV